MAPWGVGQEDLMPETLLDEEEVMGDPSMVGQPDAQEGVPRGHSGRAQLLLPAPEETSMLLLVPTLTKDVKMEVQVQLEICS